MHVEYKTRIRIHLRQVLAIVAVVDLIVLTSAVVLAWELRLTLDVWSVSPVTDLPLTSTAAPWLILAWMVFLTVEGAYSSRLFGSGPEEFKLVLFASFLTACTVGLGCYLLQVDLSRGFLLLTFLLGIPMLLTERYVVRQMMYRARRNGYLQRRVVAVGGPSAVNELVDVLQRERHVGYQVVGACVPDGITVDSDAFTVPVLGSVAKTRTVCDEMDVDTVLVTAGGYASSADLRRIGWDLEESEIELVVVPSLADVAGPRIRMRPVAGLPLLHVEGPQVDEAGGYAKRAFDIAVSSLAVAILSPLLLAVIVLIKLEDGGPVFFRQTRVGRKGEAFGMLKLRSMAVDAEQRLDEIRHLNEFDGVLFKVRDDPRITRVGRFIRRFSIDEIPQLMNVIRGEMSLVGPRPPLASEVEAYADDVHRRLLVRPGMTGLWQVSGRSGLSWKESVRLDLYYVDNWSMMGDLVIMSKTVKAVVVPAGAY